MRRGSINIGSALLIAALSLWCAQALRAETPADMRGTWEGPWYRGMTSGKARLLITAGGGTIRFTNLDNFGTEEHPLSEMALEGSNFSFRSEGDKGGALTANLKLSETADAMKGLGKFDGFPLRFEIKRVAAQ
ncbi:MAG: hypothetical protein ABI612_11800 [Betaproteobacteria bacterium]